MKILITGGAGFVGASLAHHFREEFPLGSVTVLDNLKRRGSELNLKALAERGIRFVHGDIRVASDLADLPEDYDALIEASAEPSVLAGVDGSPAYVLGTNLGGTLNCLEFARRRAGAFIFLSTSRVYSIAPLRQLALTEGATRLELGARQAVPGVSAKGISEAFPTHLPRSLYGASKLASELVIQEYADTYGMKAVINRCGVLSGPGQFGKSDQGVFALWVIHHALGKPLSYTGFGGTGKQVRDILHPTDLHALVSRELRALDRCAGQVFNVGGGSCTSLSLLELTHLCREVTGRSVPVASRPDSARVDIPYYVSDCSLVEKQLGWAPAIPPREIVEQTYRWITKNAAALEPLYGRAA